MKKQQTATVPDIFARALQTCVPPAGSPVGIALSGGLDSAALLHLAHAWAQEHGVALHAFHVHHGLSPNADAWLAHCAQLCAGLGIAFRAKPIVRESAEHAISNLGLDSILYLIGFRDRDTGVFD